MENEKIERLDIVVEDIPITIIRPEKYSQNRKTIIHYHGWSSSVEKQILFAEIFAQKGYQVIMPEIVYHGKRGTLDYEEHTLFYDTLIQTVAEFKDIKKLAVERFNGDENNIVISGHSLGGMIAFAVLSIDTSIKLGTIYNSIADFDLFVEYFQIKVDKDIEETFRLFNPLNRIENFANREIRISIGQRDHVIDPKNMDLLKTKLIENNINIDNIEFSYYSDCGHAIAYKMIRDNLEYIYKKIGTTEYKKCCHI